MEKDNEMTTLPNLKKAKITINGKGIELTSYDDLVRYASTIAQTDFCPKQFRGKPAEIAIAIAYGMEHGLAPITALQNTMVVNGRPSFWGDLIMGMVRQSGKMEYFKSKIIGGAEFEDNFGYEIESKRKDDDNPVITRFTVADAKRAGLWGNPSKADTWGKYPKRMLFHRARAFNLRDNFADVLQGLSFREEVEDYRDPEYEVVNKSLDDKMNQKCIDAGLKEPETKTETDVQPKPEPETEFTGELPL